MCHRLSIVLEDVQPGFSENDPMCASLNLDANASEKRMLAVLAAPYATPGMYVAPSLAVLVSELSVVTLSAQKLPRSSSLLVERQPCDVLGLRH